MRRAVVLLAVLAFGDAEEQPAPEKLCKEHVCFRSQVMFCTCSEWGTFEYFPDRVECRCPK
jgi:hypothetical protein